MIRCSIPLRSIGFLRDTIRGSRYTRAQVSGDRENVLVGFLRPVARACQTTTGALWTWDIGLVVSNDGLHFREPIADFRIIAAYESPEMEGVPVHHGRAVTMGQGFRKTWDDRTCVWYGAWGGGGPPWCAAGDLAARQTGIP